MNHNHRCKLFFILAHQRYEIRCLDCGQVIVPDPENEVFEIAGPCEPEDVLTVNVQDGINVGDKFGG